MTHNPIFSAIQAGATFHFLMDHYADQLKKTGKTDGDVISALGSSGLGVLKESPYIDTMMRLGKALENSGSAAKFLTQIGKSLIVPPDLENIAKYLDKDINGNTIERNPKGFLDIIEMGVPYLREKVTPKVQELMDQREKGVIHKSAAEKQESTSIKIAKENDLKAISKSLGIKYYPPHR